MMDRRFTHITIWGLAVAIALGCAGCNSINPFKHDSKFMENKRTQADKMAAIWTDTVYYEAGKPPTRGFGGRIYFYNLMREAVPVEGKLVVYGYDDTKSQTADGRPSARPQSRKPDRQFEFTPEQFQSHRSDSDLGPSYSIWIPWDVLGGPRKTISLLPMFVTKDGELVRGQWSKGMLAGPDPKEPQSEQFTRSTVNGAPANGILANGSRARRVQRASYEESQLDYLRAKGPTTVGGDRATEHDNWDPKMETVTIDVPRSTDHRLRQPNDAARDLEHERVQLQRDYAVRALREIMTERRAKQRRGVDSFPVQQAPTEAPRGFSPLMPPPMQAPTAPTPHSMATQGPRQQAMMRQREMMARGFPPPQKGASMESAMNRSVGSPPLPYQQPGGDNSMYRPPMYPPTGLHGQSLKPNSASRRNQLPPEAFTIPAGGDAPTGPAYGP